MTTAISESGYCAEWAMRLERAGIPLHALLPHVRSARPEACSVSIHFRVGRIKTTRCPTASLYRGGRHADIGL